MPVLSIALMKQSFFKFVSMVSGISEYSFKVSRYAKICFQSSLGVTEFVQLPAPRRKVIAQKAIFSFQFLVL